MAAEYMKRQKLTKFCLQWLADREADPPECGGGRPEALAPPAEWSLPDSGVCVDPPPLPPAGEDQPLAKRGRGNSVEEGEDGGIGKVTPPPLDVDSVVAEAGAWGINLNWGQDVAWDLEGGQEPYAPARGLWNGSG